MIVKRYSLFLVAVLCSMPMFGQTYKQQATRCIEAYATSPKSALPLATLSPKELEEIIRQVLLKDRFDVALGMAKQTYAKTPTNWRIGYLSCLLLISLDREADAIPVLLRLLEKNNTNPGVRTLHPERVVRSRERHRWGWGRPTGWHSICGELRESVKLICWNFKPLRCGYPNITYPVSRQSLRQSPRQSFHPHPVPTPSGVGISAALQHPNHLPTAPSRYAANMSAPFCNELNSIYSSAV